MGKKYTSWGGMLQSVSPINIHQGMFTNSMTFLASEEQQKLYVPLCDNLNILGCYAQTELGHGSNVQGIETTATLDLSTDEWIIHTPSIKAVKFWPGGLGVQATHAVIFAKLSIGSKSHGVQPLIAHIRSLENHLPFEGIDVGDIGAKLGYAAVDNGYLSFNHFRIPRENLLSRFVYVDKKGKFERRGDPRAIYQVMVSTRVGIIQNLCWFAIARSSLISIRYAACRRQFKTSKGSGKERKLLDYQTHMAVLGPHLAA